MASLWRFYGRPADRNFFFFFFGRDPHLMGTDKEMALRASCFVSAPILPPQNKHPHYFIHSELEIPWGSCWRSWKVLLVRTMYGYSGMAGYPQVSLSVGFGLCRARCDRFARAVEIVRFSMYF